MTTKEHEILVSIIIPAYNVEKYIGATLESICKNKLDDVEIIVVDDGSTDNTRQTVEECLESLNPPHYKIIRQENTLQRQAEQLVQAANDSGGRDNIAVILVDPFQ